MENLSSSDRSRCVKSLDTERMGLLSKDPDEFLNDLESRLKGLLGHWG